MLATSNVEPFRTTSRAIDDRFETEVIAGLSQSQKSLPSRYFYDARGSELFEQITRLAEYYPTRAEVEILSTHALVNDLPRDGVLVEFGSGSSRKTELLLNDLPSGATYVAVDVSLDALRGAGARLTRRFPRLDIRLIVGDFSKLTQLPIDLLGRPMVGFFPGSTIGNLLPMEAVDLLARFRRLLSAPSRLIVGVDLKKDKPTMLRAYNDGAGVTAAFNLNLLQRINREIEPAFNLSAFRHTAIFNARESRIEMHLVSTRDQLVKLRRQWFALRAGETIHTENSYKYAARDFHSLARRAGWRPKGMWTDSSGLFSVHELR